MTHETCKTQELSVTLSESARISDLCIGHSWKLILASTVRWDWCIIREVAALIGELPLHRWVWPFCGSWLETSVQRGLSPPWKNPVEWCPWAGPARTRLTGWARTNKQLGHGKSPLFKQALECMEITSRAEVLSKTPDTRRAFLVVHVDEMIWRWSVAVIFKLQPRAVRAPQNSLTFPERQVI